MIPIVNGLEKKYRRCLTVVSVNYHAPSPLRETLRPFGSPEFFLLDKEGVVQYRWFGRTDAEEFETVLNTAC